MEQEEPENLEPDVRVKEPGNLSPAAQLGVVVQHLSWAETKHIKQEPEEGLSSQRWETQWQEFLKTMQTPCPEEGSPQQPETVTWGEMKSSLPHFEEAAATSQWTRGESGARLPTGTAQQANIRLDTVSSRDQMAVKEIKTEDPTSSEVQCRHFRQLCYQDAQGPRKTYSQLQELCYQWLMPERHTKEQILDLVILEQFLAILPSEMQAWVKEHGSDSCFHAVTLAEDFLLRHQAAMNPGQQVPGLCQEVVMGKKGAVPEPLQRQLSKEVKQENEGDACAMGNGSQSENEGDACWMPPGREKSQELEENVGSQCWPDKPQGHEMEVQRNVFIPCQDSDICEIAVQTGMLKRKRRGQAAMHKKLFQGVSHGAQNMVAMADGGENIDLVSDLLKNPLSRRAFPEKQDIVRRGRPTPTLASLSQPVKGFVRHFQTSAYERYHWLTASEEHCKLYCWECLLFASDRLGVWSHRGFANLSCLTKAAGRHQTTVGHLQAAVLLRTFGEARVDLQLNEQLRRETELHNEKVKKNREMLKRLIDCVVFLGKQELSFRGHDESAGSTNRGNYMELLSFLAEKDADLHYHLSTNKAFCGRIQNNLISAIGDVMGEEIKKEIEKTAFVALMVNETTDGSNVAQLALVLRYVTETGVKERFVTFENFTSGRRADDIAALIVRFLEEYECLDKVVAQCFDGAAVMSSGQNRVQAKIKERAPMALFIHCCVHRLNLVLTQGVSKLKECKIFFAHLNCLAAFFSRCPKHTQLLDEICKLRLPCVAPTHWQYTSRLVSTVLERRDALKELFNHILEHHEEYDEDSVHCADEFNTCLDDFEFCFLLHAFNGILEHSGVLFGILQKNTLDVQFCLARVKEFCDTIERERGRFGDLYTSAVRISGAPSIRRRPVQNDIRTHYQQLHNNVLNNILCQIRNRFQDHEQLMFLSLLDHQQFQAYRKKFPHTSFSSLKQSHGTLFDLSCLKTELTVMYAMTDFEGKCPTDLLDFLQKKNLIESMPQLYRLACLTLTIPISPATVKQTFSALKRIKTYARNTTGQSRLTALASMAIEKDLLMELKRTDHLHDRVIEVFLCKERRMDFVYK